MKNFSDITKLNKIKNPIIQLFLVVQFVKLIIQFMSSQKNTLTNRQKNQKVETYFKDI